MKKLFRTALMACAIACYAGAISLFALSAMSKIDPVHAIILIHIILSGVAMHVAAGHAPSATGNSGGQYFWSVPGVIMGIMSLWLIVDLHLGGTDVPVWLYLLAIPGALGVSLSRRILTDTDDDEPTEGDLSGKIQEPSASQLRRYIGTGSWALISVVAGFIALIIFVSAFYVALKAGALGESSMVAVRDYVVMLAREGTWAFIGIIAVLAIAGPVSLYSSYRKGRKQRRSRRELTESLSAEQQAYVRDAFLEVQESVKVHAAQRGNFILRIAAVPPALLLLMATYILPALPLLFFVETALWQNRPDSGYYFFIGEADVSLVAMLLIGGPLSFLLLAGLAIGNRWIRMETYGKAGKAGPMPHYDRLLKDMAEGRLSIGLPFSVDSFFRSRARRTVLRSGQWLMAGVAVSGVLALVDANQFTVFTRDRIAYSLLWQLDDHDTEYSGVETVITRCVIGKEDDEEAISLKYHLVLKNGDKLYVAGATDSDSLDDFVRYDMGDVLLIDELAMEAGATRRAQFGADDDASDSACLVPLGKYVDEDARQTIAWLFSL